LSKTIFETDAWISAISCSYNYTKYIVDNSVFLHVKSFIFGDRLISLPFSDYGKLTPNVYSEKFQLLIENTNVEYLEARIPDWKTETFKAFKEAGFAEAVVYRTFLLNIEESSKVLWNKLGKKIRNSIRYALKNRVELKRVESLEDLKQFYYNLYLIGARELGSPPHSFKLYENLRNFLGDKLLIDLALVDDKLIGAIIVLLGDKWANFWQNIALRKYRKFNASYLLLWNIIEELSDGNFKIFDFGRTRENTGIYFFKKKWGGDERKIYHMVYSPSKRVIPPDPHQRKYLLLSRLWRRLPLKVTNIIGSHLIGGIAL